jgi:pimeloyl-ACP methyl ester carboxylesterase
MRPLAAKASHAVARILSRVHGVSFATSDGLRIAHSHAGTGPPIVFLHGVGSTAEIWRRQMLGLAPTLRCIALDYRGYGHSDVPSAASLTPAAGDPQAISRAAFARDMFAVLDASRLASAHLCGCSLGGVVALEGYARASERVRSLILVDTFAFYPGGVGSVDQRIQALDAMGIEDFARSRAPGVLHPDSPAERVEFVRAQMASIPLEVYKAATRATWTGDYRDMLPRIAVPVLVLWGERDTITPYELSAEIAYSLREPSRVMVVPHAGHLPNVDNPEFFNHAISTFVHDVEQR